MNEVVRPGGASRNGFIAVIILLALSYGGAAYVTLMSLPAPLRLLVEQCAFLALIGLLVGIIPYVVGVASGRLAVVLALAGALIYPATSLLQL